MANGKMIAEQPEILTKLELAFSWGCTDEEACAIAGISCNTLYNYIDNVNPDFKERKNNLKLLTTVKSKHNISLAVENNDLPTSRWHLEKRSDEYKPPSQATLTLNQFNMFTDDKLREQLAHKLTKVLTQGQVKDAEYTVNKLDSEGDSGS